MEKSIKINIEQAKELYKSNNAILKEIALQAFSEKECKDFDYSSIKTFEDALCALNYTQNEVYKIIEHLNEFSKATVAMFKLNIIRKALNKGQKLSLTENATGQTYTWCPCVRFTTENSTHYDDNLRSGEYKKLGKFMCKRVTYNVLDTGASSSKIGLGCFYPTPGVGTAIAALGFLGCATKEVAKHFGKYFGMLIMEAMYGDIEGFEIIYGEKE